MDNIHHIPSLQGLQALVEVADSGSFTQAAQTLCLTQSAVSRKIQQLESHFGVPMFVRTSRSLGEAARISDLDQCLQALQRRNVANVIHAFTEYLNDLITLVVVVKSL